MATIGGLLRMKRGSHVMVKGLISMVLRAVGGVGGDGHDQHDGGGTDDWSVENVRHLNHCDAMPSHENSR